MTETLHRVEANQQDLVRELDRVRARLERHARRATNDAPAAPERTIDARDPHALETLVRLFALSPFERDVVLLCAGAELDARFPAAIGDANGDPMRVAPTFGLALAALDGAHWSALTPAGALRTWRLVEVAGTSVTQSPLRLDERVLHFLTGIQQIDERLRGRVEAIDARSAGRADLQAVAARVAAQSAGQGGARAAQITGGDADAREAVAGAAAAALGATCLRIDASELPPDANERFALSRLVAREALLVHAVVCIDVTSESDARRVASFGDALPVPWWVSTPDPIAALAGRAAAFELAPTTGRERLALWEAAIGPAAAGLNGAITRASSHFDLRLDAVRAAAARACAEASKDPDVSVADALWDACRVAARARIDGLAQRIDASVAWEDLVLPDLQKRCLRDIVMHVRQRHRVHEEWGFAERGARGLGITALFAGASGTGKTMAAEVVARELRLDLYRIDLASVVSKYIGETEKNLRRLFDAAEGSGAILLFDEADALFGKRSEVKDSHDRYANVEVSYLLQRMEAYRGLAILTTNLRAALDAALMRRLRFVIPFSFPDAEQRAAIWRRVFPERTPTDSLDFARLAQLNVPGGHIRNIALAAAFLAAEAGEPVAMRHVADAARNEYAKLERTLGDAETRGWA